MLTTSVGYHSEPLKMDPDGMALGGGNAHPDPFSGGSPPFTGGNEEEFESVQLPPGALSEEQQAAQQSHSLHSHHHPGGVPASQASSHYPPHYSHLSAQLYHQQHPHLSHPHPHHAHHPQQQPPPQWNPYGMNGYVGTGATGGGYHPLHHAPPMDASSYYYSSASGPPPSAQPPSSAYHPPNPSGGAQQSMALPGGPSPAGSHNTPSPQAHSEDGDNSDPHLRNNNVLKRPGVDYSSSSPHVHSLMNPGSYHPPLPPAKKAKAPKRKKKRDPNEPQKPVSAYALFFRDSQANIKAANPNAAFGDVSKIVASMWDGLDPDNKAAYKKRTENAKKEYLKKLAAYRASLVSKGSGNSPINESGSSSAVGSTPPSAPPSSSNNHPPSYGPGAGPYGPYSYGEPPNNSNTGLKPSPNEGYNGPNSSPYPNSQQQLPRQPSYGPPVGGYLHPNQQMSNGGYGHHHPVSHPPSSVLPPNSAAPPDNRSSSSPPSGSSPLDSRTHLDPTTGHLIETEGGGAPPNGSNSNNANGAHHLHQQHHPHSSNSGSNSSNNRGRRPLSCARPGCNNPISSNEAWSSNSEFCSNECVVGQCRDVYSSWSGASGPPSTAPPPPPPPNGQVQTQ